MVGSIVASSGSNNIVGGDLAGYLRAALASERPALR